MLWRGVTLMLTLALGAVPEGAALAQGNSPTVSVAITSPASGAVVTAPGAIALQAAASVNRQNWVILRVEFYSGAQLIGTATAAPYAVTWANVPAGSYSVTARAIATNAGQAKQDPATHPNMPTWEAVSAPVSVIVNAAPTVAITAPAPNTVVNAPANLIVSAAAADSDGSIAKVEFYAGAALIGTATSAPYSINWANVAAGSYSLTAVATDNRGASTTSAAVAISVNALPTVSLTAPANNATFTAPASIALAANAADADGTVAKVEFYQGGTLIGTATAAPYTFNWTPVAAGNYVITARATDNLGATATSGAVSINVNAAPTVSLTAPANNALYTAPASITLAANAADADGTVARVEFYQGATLIGTATTAPYTYTWSNVAAGSYALTAQAFDNQGAGTTSAPVTVMVNAAPAVSLTSPANNAVFAAPATITVTASASDSDGTIAKVEFYQGTSLIGTATSAPYSISWANVAAGNYSLTAVATDNHGASTTSAVVAINVNAVPTVSLTSPANNATFTAPASITLAATAADPDGTVAKVEFFHGATLIGTATAAPYTFNWTPVAAGNYVITARATDNLGATATSGAVSINVNATPTVSLTAPAAGASYTAPATIALTASAADSDGTIAKVEFYQGATLLATVINPPYAFTWTNVAAGNYTLTARATDNQGAESASAPVSITVTVPVNVAPTVSLTSPANSATFNAPANVTLAADAADSDGSIAKVEFYSGSTLITTLTNAPYAFTWTNVAAGSYTLTARATDNQGATTISAPVSVTVTVPVNAAPTVSLTSPASGATFSAPADIPLAANAADSDGTVAKVEFFHGSTLIATLTAPPYSVLWTGVPLGSYTLTAKATDNQGAATTSAPVTVTVSGAVASTLYYIHTDHLNTPRVITNQASQVVWRWDNIDPFGGNAPNENPSGLGNFACNLRLPGQYFDRETGMHYNYFRDYDSLTGRYVQSDPIGLRGGINTYVYTDGNPLGDTDSRGLASNVGRQVAASGKIYGQVTGKRVKKIDPYDLPSGNLWGGTNPQDWVCTQPAGILNANVCTQNCCLIHDQCYDQFGCNASSWLVLFPTACQICNARAIACMFNAAVTGCQRNC